jgi:hypothetical protein
MDIVRDIEEHRRNDRDDDDDDDEEVCFLYLVQKGKPHSLAYSPSFYVLQIGHEHLRKLLKGISKFNVSPILACFTRPSQIQIQIQIQVAGEIDMHTSSINAKQTS